MSTKHPLRQWREAHGLTGAELGELVGVDKSTVSAYENRRRMPRQPILVELRRLSDGVITADSFLPELPPAPAAAAGAVLAEAAP